LDFCDAALIATTGFRDEFHQPRLHTQEDVML